MHPRGLVSIVCMPVLVYLLTNDAVVRPFLISCSRAKAVCQRSSTWMSHLIMLMWLKHLSCYVLSG